MLQSCNSDFQPKPFSFLRLDYPKPIYKRIKLKKKSHLRPIIDHLFLKKE